MQPFELLHDRHDPARLDPDLLAQRPAVDTLVEAIRRVVPPTCVALYGRWGSGKTSLLQMARRKCHKIGIPTIWFDPWEYERQGDCLSPLIDRLYRSAGESLDARSAGRLYLRSMVDSLSRFGGADAAGPGPVGGAGPGAEHSLERWSSRHAEVDALKLNFARLVDAILRPPVPDDGVDGAGGDVPPPAQHHRLVFLLDDLDRCLPETVIRLLESIKLLLCGDSGCRAVFVFALDRDVVSQAVRSRFGGSRIAGERYLEKIFDFSLEVPLLRDPEIKALIHASLSHSLDAFQWLEDCFASDVSGGMRFVSAILSQPIFSNPRVVKRTLNRLSLLLLDGPRRRRVKDIRDRRLYRILIAWCAGAERFRPFRRLFFEMSLPELAEFHRALRGRGDGDTPIQNPTVAWLLTTPDFLGYCHQLGLGEFDSVEALDDQRCFSADRSAIKTLYDIEDLMRSAGL